VHHPASSIADTSTLHSSQTHTHAHAVHAQQDRNQAGCSCWLLPPKPTAPKPATGSIIRASLLIRYTARLLGMEGSEVGWPRTFDSSKKHFPSRNSSARQQPSENTSCTHTASIRQAACWGRHVRNAVGIQPIYRGYEQSIVIVVAMHTVGIVDLWFTRCRRMVVVW
jgi:hypothetical protein